MLFRHLLAAPFLEFGGTSHCTRVGGVKPRLILDYYCPPPPHGACDSIPLTEVTQLLMAEESISFLISGTALGGRGGVQLIDFTHFFAPTSELWSQAPQSPDPAMKAVHSGQPLPSHTPVCSCPETATRTFLPVTEPHALSNASKIEADSEGHVHQ